MHKSNVQSKTYLILARNDIRILQTQCTSSVRSSPRHIATVRNTKIPKLVCIPIEKLLVRHIDLPTNSLPSRHLGESETFHLRLDATALQLVGQLRVVGGDTVHNPRLSLVERLEQHVKRGFELACDAADPRGCGRTAVLRFLVDRLAPLERLGAADRLLPLGRRRAHGLVRLLGRDDRLLIPGVCLRGDRLGGEQSLDERVVRSGLFHACDCSGRRPSEEGHKVGVDDLLVLLEP